jgi:hypothetical protein
MARSNLIVYTANDVWTKPANCYAIYVLVRGGGGSGASGMFHSTQNQRQPGPGGGGGGAVRTQRRIAAFQLPDTVPVTVGTGGAAPATPPSTDGSWTPGNNGGDSSFHDIIARGGRGGGFALASDTPEITSGGAGGYAVYIGGTGGAQGAAGQSTSTGILGGVDLLGAGGGGGSGSGYVGGSGLPAYGAGGASNKVPAGTSNPTFWQWCQSGGGGHGGGFGGFPSGGGGGGDGGGQVGGAGANGVVVILELLYDEE